MQIRTRLLATLTAAAVIAGSVTPAAATSKSDRDFLRGALAAGVVGGLLYYSQQNRAQAQQPSYYAPVTRQAAPQQVYRAPAPTQQYATSYRAPVQHSAIAQGFTELTAQRPPSASNSGNLQNEFERRVQIAAKPR